MCKSIIKTFIFISIFALITPSCVAQKTNENSMTRTISIEKAFSGLKTHSSIEITYTQNSRPSEAIITGPEEVVAGMTYEVNSKGILKFNFPNHKNSNLKVNGKIKILLNGPILQNYEATSAGVIKVTTPITSKKNLNLQVSSSGNIILQKNVSALNQSVNLAVSSSGNIKFLENLECEESNFALASSAGIKIPQVTCKNMNYAGSSTASLEIDSIDVDTANLAVSSGAEGEIETCKANSLNLTASSGSDIKLENVTAKMIVGASSSGSEISLSGKAETGILTAASGGRINISKIRFNNLQKISQASGGKIIK